MKKVLVSTCAALALAGCASFPTATGEIAQATADTAQAVQAQTIDSISYLDTNVPAWLVLLVALGFWCVRTPWGLVSDFLFARRNR